MKLSYLFIMMFLVCSATRAVAAERDAAGQVRTVRNPAYVVRGAENIEAKAGMAVMKSDVLLTGKQGTMGVVFRDNSTLSLGPDTKFQLSNFEFNVLERKVCFIGRIRHGSMVYLSGLIAKMNANATRFETPVAVAGIRGTKLAILVEGGDNE